MNRKGSSALRKQLVVDTKVRPREGHIFCEYGGTAHRGPLFTSRFRLELGIFCDSFRADIQGQFSHSDTFDFDSRRS